MPMPARRHGRVGPRVVIPGGFTTRRLGCIGAPNARFGSHSARAAPTVRGVSEQAPPVLPPAGWYPHPEVSGAQRYWDGLTWTDDVVTGRPVPMVRPSQSVWVPIGWVCAFVFPLAGFVIGFFLPRKYSQQGLWMMAVSVVVVFILLAIYPR
jgi:Protein of unknown function (DUF2510)